MNIKREQLFKQTEFSLGTFVEFQVYGDDANKANNAIKLALTEIKRIDELFSSYNEKSEIYKINNSKQNQISLSQEVYNILKLCDSIYKITNGNLDCAIGKVTFIWKDFLTKDEGNLPPVSEIRNRLNESGWKNIELSDKVLSRTKNVEFDLGGIAKGYAVDRAIEVLKSSGIKKALVNAGGDIRTIGDGWIIGIQHPRERNQIIEKIKLDNRAVATSGDYEQFKVFNGKRYHHIINPFNGYPVSNCMSVTVIAESDAYADGLSTGIFLLGVEKGLQLVNSLPEVEAFIVDKEGQIHMSEGFKNYLWR